MYSRLLYSSTTVYFIKVSFNLSAVLCQGGSCAGSRLLFWQPAMNQPVPLPLSAMTTLLINVLVWHPAGSCFLGESSVMSSWKLINDSLSILTLVQSCSQLFSNMMMGLVMLQLDNAFGSCSLCCCFNIFKFEKNVIVQTIQCQLMITFTK